MSSAKTERLVNLTMALLGTRRFMPKSEIFRRVEGYSGSQETKERMFERDKDELRALGIEIEVASDDPIFEDEPGYRIRPDTYQFPQSFSSDELGIMSTAITLLADSDIAATTESILRRLNSLPLAPRSLDEIAIPERELLENGLTELTSAMSKRMTIRFRYQKLNSAQDELRRVNVMGLSAWRGNWYAVGEDLDRDDIRAFKLSRFTSSVEGVSKPGSYEIPVDFSVRDYLVMFQKEDFEVRLRLRKGSGTPLRERAKEIQAIDDDWDEVTLGFYNQVSALREALWLGNDCVVIAPEPLRQAVMDGLKKIASWHG